MTRTRCILFSLLVAACSPAISAETWGPFSATFKESIDAAMAEMDLDVREQQLNAALSHGTDHEVFYLIPILFQPELLDWAEHVGICKVEIDEVVSLTGAFYYSSTDERETFPSDRSAEIRADTSKLIHCLSQYNIDGTRRVPATQSNNSFKPKPLRGSA